MRKPGRDRESGQRSDRNRGAACCCCEAEPGFVWSCRCGFAICQECMEENLWGMTCNNINWECPDCGLFNGFGNQ